MTLQAAQAPVPAQAAPVGPSWVDRLKGLSVVVGLANPEWPHLGLAYRYLHVGTSLDVGSVANANALTAAARFFGSDRPGGPYAEVGISAQQLVPVSDVTPQDVFFTKYLGLGWQFAFPHLIINTGLGLAPFTPPRSAAPPMVIIGTGLLPHFSLEVGYAF